MFDLHRSTHHTLRRIGMTLALVGSMSWIARPVHSQTGPQQTSSLSQGGLTLEDRISYQRTIEEVYWRHRIWPKENPQAKPNLDELMPLSAIRAKVEDYLSKSQALAAYWQRPITGAQLQAEMERMARQTKQPAMLKELWAALGNDPYVIAECLARPSLANRLIRNWYAHDERYHGELKRRAEADLRAYGTASPVPAEDGQTSELRPEWSRNGASQVRQMSGEYHEMKWVQTPHPQPPSQRERVAHYLSQVPSPSGRGWSRDAGPGEGTDMVAAAISDGRPAVGTPPLQPAEGGLVPVGELSRLQEDDERFYVTAVLEKGHAQLKVATAEWRKQPFDTWWRRVRDQMQVVAAVSSPPTLAPVSPPPPGDPEPGYAYRLAAIRSGSGTCVDDTWTPTPGPLISPRAVHTAIWTGSEMIIWGGVDGGGLLNTGGRYDPATDTWTATSTSNAPNARSLHTAVWTGNEMIVWGGGTPTATNSGGRYDPATDTWIATATDNAPSVRQFHTAVWTGSEMIVWGGLSSLNPTYLNTGGRYNAAADTWTPTATTNAPSERSDHTAVWTGSEMIVWGGRGGLDTGGRYCANAGTLVTARAFR